MILHLKDAGTKTKRWAERIIKTSAGGFSTSLNSGSLTSISSSWILGLWMRKVNASSQIGSMVLYLIWKQKQRNEKKKDQTSKDVSWFHASQVNEASNANMSSPCCQRTGAPPWTGRTDWVHWTLFYQTTRKEQLSQTGNKNVQLDYLFINQKTFKQVFLCNDWNVMM